MTKVTWRLKWRRPTAQSRGLGGFQPEAGAKARLHVGDCLSAVAGGGLETFRLARTGMIGSVEITVILYYVLVRIQITEEGGEIRQHGTGAADGAEN